MQILRESGFKGLFTKVREAGVTMPYATVRIHTRGGAIYEAFQEVYRDSSTIGFMYYDQTQTQTQLSHPVVFLALDDIARIELDSGDGKAGKVKSFKDQ